MQSTSSGAREVKVAIMEDIVRVQTRRRRTSSLLDLARIFIGAAAIMSFSLNSRLVWRTRRRRYAPQRLWITTRTAEGEEVVVGKEETRLVAV